MIHMGVGWGRVVLGVNDTHGGGVGWGRVVLGVNDTHGVVEWGAKCTAESLRRD